MKACCFTLLIFISFLLQGQIRYDFESGLDSCWYQNPGEHWGADSTGAISGNRSLHQVFDNTESGNDRISLPLTNLTVDSGTVVFTFRIRHGYSPSASNKWAVFLYADQDAGSMKTGTTVNGYVLGVNYSGSDDLIKLWKISNGSLSTVIITGFNWQEKIGTDKAVDLRVTREPGGFWEVEMDTIPGTGPFFSLGEGQDDEYLEANYFGISYIYSSTKDRLFWFDEFRVDGRFMVDILPPQLTSFSVKSDHEILLNFSEQVKAQTGMYIVQNWDIVPDTVIYSGTTCLLHFTSTFPDNETLVLNYSGITDKAGNCIEAGTFNFSFHENLPGDLIINEIMADPTPVVSLPDAEYLELYNTTENTIGLSGWKLEAGNSKWIFPDIQLESRKYLLITSGSAISQFAGNFTVLGFFSSSGSLGNTGSSLVLISPKGTVISAVRYEDSWYGSSEKKDGGWALERKDPAAFCSGQDNWTASISTEGGTPGEPNSVFESFTDYEAPWPERVAPLNDSLLLLVFNETPDSAQACLTGNYSISNGPGEPTKIWQLEPEGREFQMSLAEKLQVAKDYELVVHKGIRDCYGNSQEEEFSLPFGMAEEADSLDILFSEILYDVPENSSEFLEIYNRSSKVIDLMGMQVATLNTVSQEIQSKATISNTPRLLFPGGYLALSSFPERLGEYYTIKDPSALQSVQGMPLLSNSGGCAELLNKGLSVLDRVCWSDLMHHPLIENTQGVSLERSNFEGSSMQSINWHSAASLAGYATPGYENSQYSGTGIGNEKIKVVPEIITPNNDGRDDFAEIRINMGEPGWIAHVYIYDTGGRLVKELLNNALTGCEGIISWDGTDSKGAVCYNGIYIIRINLFNLKGSTFEAKKVCVLSLR
jgi:hypothetical protein